MSARLETRLMTSLSSLFFLLLSLMRQTAMTLTCLLLEPRSLCCGCSQGFVLGVPCFVALRNLIRYFKEEHLNVKYDNRCKTCSIRTAAFVLLPLMIIISILFDIVSLFLGSLFLIITLLVGTLACCYICFFPSKSCCYNIRSLERLACDTIISV